MALSSYSHSSSSPSYRQVSESDKRFFSHLNPLYLQKAPPKVDTAHHFFCGKPSQQAHEQSFASTLAKGEIKELSACLDFLFKAPLPLDKSDSRELVKKLFSLWFAQDPKGNTPLHLALMQGQHLPLSCLFSYPLMPSLYHFLFQANREGKSLLYLAADHEALFKELVELPLPLDLRLQLLMSSPSLLLHPSLSPELLRPLIRSFTDDSFKQLRGFLPLDCFQVLLYLMDETQVRKTFEEHITVRECVKAKVKLVNFLKESFLREKMPLPYGNHAFLWEVSLARDLLKQNPSLSEEGKKRLKLCDLEIMGVATPLPLPF